jgi:hypothetical protein
MTKEDRAKLREITFKVMQQALPLDQIDKEIERRFINWSLTGDEDRTLSGCSCQYEHLDSHKPQS